MTHEDLPGLSTSSTADGDQVFVVRFWLERAPSRQEPALWRGRVTNVNTSKETHVGSIDDAFGFIRDVLAKLTTPHRRQDA